MREFVSFLLVCVLLVVGASATSAAPCQPADTPAVENLRHDVAPAATDETRCLPRQREPAVPPQQPPAFDFPDDPAPAASESVPQDVSIASIAAAVVGAVSAYFATRESEAEEDEPAAPDVV